MLMRQRTTSGWLRTLLFVIPLLSILVSACVPPAGTAPAAAPAQQRQLPPPLQKLQPQQPMLIQ